MAAGRAASGPARWTLAMTTDTDRPTGARLPASAAILRIRLRINTIAVAANLPWLAAGGTTDHLIRRADTLASEAGLLCTATVPATPTMCVVREGVNATAVAALFRRSAGGARGAAETARRKGFFRAPHATVAGRTGEATTPTVVPVTAKIDAASGALGKRIVADANA